MRQAPPISGKKACTNERLAFAKGTSDSALSPWGFATKAWWGTWNQIQATRLKLIQFRPNGTQPAQSTQPPSLQEGLTSPKLIRNTRYFATMHARFVADSHTPHSPPRPRMAMSTIASRKNMKTANWNSGNIIISIKMRCRIAGKHNEALFPIEAATSILRWKHNEVLFLIEVATSILRNSYPLSCQRPQV